MSAMKSHPGGYHLARSIALVSVVLVTVVFAWCVFAAQPPGQAPPPKAGPPAGPAPSPKAGPPPAPPRQKPSYVVYPVDEGLKNDGSKVQAMRRAGQFGSGEQAVFDRYYEKYALARWSVPENRAAVQRYRGDLRRDLLNPKTGAVRDHLNALALDFMRKMATECYPVARFNAMLMIGELNAVEQAGFGTAPVPLPAALPVLVSAVGDPQQLDAVKVGALVGILRHLELGAIKAPDDVKAVGDAALAVAGSKRPPGRSADGHAWMRKLAAEVLGELGAVGDKGVVATTLAGMVAEAATPFYARCSAAEALGKLTYPADAGLDASKLAVPLGRLAVDACAAEPTDRAEARAKTKASNQGFLRATPSWSSSGKPVAPQEELNPPNPIPPVFRNRLRYRVHAASFGLGGTKENPGGVASLAKGTPHEKTVTALQQHLQAILGLIEETKSDHEIISKETEPSGLTDKIEIILYYPWGNLYAMMKKINAEADKIATLLAKLPK